MSKNCKIQISANQGLNGKIKAHVNAVKGAKAFAYLLPNQKYSLDNRISNTIGIFEEDLAFEITR